MITSYGRMITSSKWKFDLYYVANAMLVGKALNII